MKIPWIDSSGLHRVYVPDVLVRFRKGQFLGRRVGRPLLIELKHRNVLRKNWELLRPKLRAGIRAAAQHGWRFKILTNEQTRGLVLQNAEFIRKHLHTECDCETTGALKIQIVQSRNCTAEQLAAALDRNGCVERSNLDAVWALVAQGIFATDLEVPILPSSPIFKGFRYDH